ncbi:MAG: methyltransferase, partial [Roseinatronobacter sp.]
MNAPRRAGGRRSKAGRTSTGLPQLPWQNLTNPYAPMEIADADGVEAIHRTSLRILSELGI